LEKWKAAMQIETAFDGNVFWTWKRLENLPPDRILRRKMISNQARLALCDLAGTVTGEPGLAYIRADSGKPALQRSNGAGQYGASITHSGDIFAVAFCPIGQIGIDIEYRDLARNVARLEKWLFGVERRVDPNQFDPDRMHQIENDPRRFDFYQQWCVYEAIFKCTSINDPALRLPSDTFYLDNWPDYAGALVWQSMLTL
jgi:4'-phosphopantetheinyl transferase|tara:strand:+ start:953 stop:1552 length:600 start_codon:yes stop_codon:yes gene_type:complete